MSNPISLIAFGTFGNPNGFTHSIFIGDPNLKNSLKTFDLNTNAIKLFQGEKLYSIRKENISNKTYISYSVYQYAKEPNSNREGSFIGISVVSINYFINEYLIINILNDGINNLYKNNVTNEIINVNKSDQFIVNNIKDFDKIEINSYNLNLKKNQKPDKSLFIYTLTDENNLSKLLKESTHLLNSYDTIYFSQNSNIAEEVIKKGLFELIEQKDFEQKINQIIELEKQKILETKTKISNSITSLREDLNKIISQKESSIAYKTEIHQKNTDLIHHEKKELNEIKQNFTSKINHLINKFNQSNNDQLPEIEGDILILKNDLNKNNSISTNTVQSIENHTNVRKVENRHQAPHFENYDHNNIKKENGISLSKISSIVMFLALIGLSYFTYNLYTNLEIKDNKIKLLQNNPKPEEHVEINQLNPFPNSQLNDNDLQLINDKLNEKNLVNIEDLVNVIFETNPNSIKKYYQFQKNDYKLYLYQLNENSFQKNGNGDTIYAKALPLKKVPSTL